MTIEKLPSGSYRATVMQEGKRYRKTFDHKPTQKEVLQALAEEMDNTPKNAGLSFRAAAKQYTESKRNVLSPSTLRDYVKYPDRLPAWFSDMNIDAIDQLTLNKVINEISEGKAPKTVRNYHAFISAILGTYRPNMKIYTTLPQKRKNEPYIPSDNDVKRILDALKDTEYYVPIMLACYGLRRSEIAALTINDIEGTIVHIRKAKVLNENNEWVEKTTKTTESERDIYISEELANMIRENGYVMNVHPGNIIKHLSETEKKLGIEHFSLHKLRHYFASKMLTVTDSKTVQALGGWKSDNVLKTVYAHSLKEEQEKAKKEAVKVLSGLM